MAGCWKRSGGLSETSSVSGGLGRRGLALGAPAAWSGSWLRSTATVGVSNMHIGSVRSSPEAALPGQASSEVESPSLPEGGPCPELVRNLPS